MKMRAKITLKYRIMSPQLTVISKSIKRKIVLEKLKVSQLVNKFSVFY